MGRKQWEELGVKGAVLMEPLALEVHLITRTMLVGAAEGGTVEGAVPLVDVVLEVGRRTVWEQFC